MFFLLSENDRSLFLFPKIVIVPLSSLFVLFLFSSFLSKLLEYICFQQLNAFVSNAEIIPSYQSNFRRLHSATNGAILLSDLVFKNFDLGYLTSIVALDFSKAFEIVNNFLLVKLHMCDLSHRL